MEKPKSFSMQSINTSKGSRAFIKEQFMDQISTRFTKKKPGSQVPLKIAHPTLEHSAHSHSAKQMPSNLLSLNSSKYSSHFFLSPPDPSQTTTPKTLTRLAHNTNRASMRAIALASPKKPKAKPTEFKFPMRSGVAINLLADSLTEFEGSEILQYQEIFFVGCKASKLVPTSAENNHGYDDANCDYKLMKGDHVAYRYEIGNMLGKGTFGHVYQCFDHKRKENVAVKVIKNKKRFNQQAVVEIGILRTLAADTKTIIKIKNHFLFRNHVCIVFELMTLNLYEFMKLSRFEGVPLPLIKNFATQILTALSHTRKHKIIHCDLKPENLLLESVSSPVLKLIDFGSGCFAHERVYTYIQSRFYRAPEIMLGIPYTTAIDIWSLGCILVELFTGYPLFPAESELDLFSMIVEMKGLPPNHLIAVATRKQLFFSGNTPNAVRNRSGKVRVPGSRLLTDVVKCEDREFLSFVGMCVEWDYEARITPEEALTHPFFTGNLEKRPIVKRKINTKSASSIKLPSSYILN